MAIFKEKTRVVKENPGTGKIINDHLIDEKLFGGSNSMFSRITLHPGCGVPFHKHEGNNETYYILQGEGVYQDEDKKAKVKAGYVTFCVDGGSHGLMNTSKEDLVFVALIANTMA